MVSGLSSSDYNAGQIADVVAKLTSASADPLILIGYSKGATDILHFLVKYPLLAERVTAVLSVAGAINGSPVADKYAETYARWFSGFSLAQCEPGDGGVVESLRRSAQLPWLASHRLPDTVKYFSLVSFTHRERIALALLMTYDDLTQIDPRNDGQLLFYDQLVPGSTLLGYANADHWAVAIPVQERMPFFGGAETGYNYPRTVLFEAMILYLAERLKNPTLSVATESH
jgi:pimeloyl-ACP methyl ester carboxylesterase